MNVHVTRTRAAIPTQLREFFAAAGIEFKDTYIGGCQAFVVDGQAYTPAGAANRFLPGGFDGSFGGPGHRAPAFQVGQATPYTVEGVPCEVIDIFGARHARDGYLALVRDASGDVRVIPV